MIVVVGGANLDTTWRTLHVATLATSNPATAVESPGGVGRNIAENLARLGSEVTLVAPMGDDAAGTVLAQHCEQVGIVLHRLPTPHSTGRYVAVLDAGGELLVGVSDMAATDTLTVADLTRMPSAPAALAAAAVIVVEANLPPAVAAWVLETACAHGIPVVVDPVSVVKAHAFGAVLDRAHPVAVLTPNVGELEALVGRGVADEHDALVRAAAELLDRGVGAVWIRRGPRGSLLVAPGSDTAYAVVALSAPMTDVVDVTGAGDSMTAGFVHAWAAGADLPDAARYGQTVAALTCQSAHTVRPDLTATLVGAALDRSPLRRT